MLCFGAGQDSKTLDKQSPDGRHHYNNLSSPFCLDTAIAINTCLNKIFCVNYNFFVLNPLLYQVSGMF